MSASASAARPDAVHASVVGASEGSSYEIFDVESLDLAGARLTGPLLLEIGEEIMLRLVRGEARIDVRAQVTAVERGERDAVSVVIFVDEGAAERVRAVVGA